MVKRHSKASKNNSKSKFQTFSVPDPVPVPKTKREKKAQFLESERDKLETHLEQEYLDDRKKIHPKDLAVINNENNKLYSNDPKPDRRYNRGVQVAKADLKLLSFLLENLKPKYKHQILNSVEMKNIIDKYLGIADMTSVELTKEEENQALKHAIQMLIDSSTIIKKRMPTEFDIPLKESAKPFFNLLDAISKYGKLKINIPEMWI